MLPGALKCSTFQIFFCRLGAETLILHRSSAKLLLLGQNEVMTL